MKVKIEKTCDGEAFFNIPEILQKDLQWEEGVIEHVFNKFKTKDHHEVVVNYLKENA
ncbi:hypothetical protein [Vibrio harveyi]|uniref:hypothetical protein n=1 Tax=Vibrio harveyi TaxID=669 RepID=UPI00165EA2F4|nr:hypothetical protein [Vibrio harveyi]